MATTSIEKQQATLTIPAAYLDDVRAAVIDQAAQDGSRLQIEHDNVLNGRADLLDIHVADRAGTLRQLKESVSLLDQVFDADGDTTLTDTGEHLAYLLGALNGDLTQRLATSCLPEQPADVLHRLEEIRWAASEAIRLDPRRSDRMA